MASHQEDGPCMMPTLSVNSCPEAVLIKGEALGGLLTESTHNPNPNPHPNPNPPPHPARNTVFSYFCALSVGAHLIAAHT